MPDNASGFVDFNQFLNLNGDEEKRLFDEAMARAEQATQAEKGALRHSELEAGSSDAAAGDVSKTASYSDYLTAKRNAASAWAALRARSRDPRAAAVQGAVMTPEQRAAAGSADADAQAREDAIAGRVKDQWAGAQTNRAARAAYEKQQADAKAAREKADAEAANAHYGNVYAKWLANRSGNQTMNPQDGQRWAQMLSGGVDSGWGLPDRTPDQRMNTPNDRRGFAIEEDAWGTRPRSTGRPTTKKGTAY